jgi:sugar phosphate isomerase/epimerase
VECRGRGLLPRRPSTSVLKPPWRCGGNHRRYCIPGHGQMRWTKAFEILAAAGYKGRISIELEDGHFNGTEAGEKEGLLLARCYLEGC